MRILLYLLGIIAIVAFLVIISLSYVSPLEKGSFFISDDKIPESTLSFSPEILTSTGESSSSEIILTSNTPVKSVQIDLSYDPEVIYNLEIIPSVNNFFGDVDSFEVTILEVREDLGRITFAIESLPQFLEKTGKGSIATIKFRTNPLIFNQTNIEFLNKSTVMIKGSRKSILKNTTPLTIISRNMNTPTTQLSETLQN